jgi:tetratricopeptide (TPR) repeat protein
LFSAIALNEFKSAVEGAPEFANAHNNYGVVLERIGRIEEAAHHYNESLRLQPLHTVAGFNLANIKTAMHQYHDAIALYTSFLKRYEQMIKLAKRDIKQQWNIQKTKIMEQQDVDIPLHDPFTEQLLQDVHSNDPVPTQVQPSKRRIEMNDTDQQYEQILPLVWNNRAICYHNLGMNELALEGYTKALELNPELGFVKVNRK